jgi:hypothetical protein
LQVGSREQGVGSREQGAGSREQGESKKKRKQLFYKYEMHPIAKLVNSQFSIFNFQFSINLQNWDAPFLAILIFMRYNSWRLINVHAIASRASMEQTFGGCNSLSPSPLLPLSLYPCSLLPAPCSLLYLIFMKNAISSWEGYCPFFISLIYSGC